MEPLWLIPVGIALLLVPAMFGVWAWAEVIERIREEDAAIGRRTRALRLALVIASASYLVGAGTWGHPTTMAFILNVDLMHRLLLYTLIAVPWIAFGTIGLMSRRGRRTGLQGFLAERAHQQRRLADADARSRALLHVVGDDLRANVRRLEEWATLLDRPIPTDGGETVRLAPPRATMSELKELADAIALPQAPEPQDLDLDALLAEGLASVRRVAEERGVSVFQTGREGLKVHSEPGRLRQILQVLLEGALERAPRDDGLVVVTIEPSLHPGLTEIAISDNGPPLGAAEQRVAFAFETSAEGLSPARGIGYPLAVARRLAREDDGDVWIQNAPGGGTVAGLRIPTSRGA